MTKAIIPSHSLKTGDILYTSWGYDQTNIDFYQVAQICGKKKVLIVKLGKSVVENNTYTDKVVPNEAHIASELMPKMVGTYKWGENENYIRINEVSTATKWDGKPLSETACGWGH